MLPYPTDVDEKVRSRKNLLKSARSLKEGVSQNITSSSFTLVSLQLPMEESVSVSASSSFLLRSKGVSPRLLQIALHL